MKNNNNVVGRGQLKSVYFALAATGLLISSTSWAASFSFTSQSD